MTERQLNPVEKRLVKELENLLEACAKFGAKMREKHGYSRAMTSFENAMNKAEKIRELITDQP